MTLAGQPKTSLTARLLLLAVLFVGYVPAVMANTLALFHYGDSPAYQELISSLRESLASNPAGAVKTINIATSPLSPTSLSGLAPSSPLYIAVGTRATERLMALAPDKPVLSVLIPRQNADEIVAKYRPGSGQFAAIYMDQPPQRIIRLLQILLPQAKSLGVLATPATTQMRDEIIAVAAAARLKTTSGTIAQTAQLYQELPSMLDHCDVLYPVPDPRIYASTTIEYLFLTSYRKHVPIIGFSETSVRAGAVAAVYSTPTQIGKQLASTIKSLLTNAEDIITNTYPLLFDIKINIQVARSLGLKITDQAAILLKLQSSEIRK